VRSFAVEFAHEIVKAGLPESGSECSLVRIPEIVVDSGAALSRTAADQVTMIAHLAAFRMDDN